MTLGEHTRKLKNSGGKALVAFFTAGYPDEGTFVRLVQAAASAGCDVIEIGIPFSDPIADGPLIQESSKVALEKGMSLGRSIELAAQLSRVITTPLVFMSYCNPILRMGHAQFAARARTSNVAGVIIPDVPIEESAALRDDIASEGITYIDLLAPTSSDARIERTAENAAGFLYLVSVTGVTGVNSPDAGQLEKFVDRVRKRTTLPLYVGFGISDSERAKAATRYCDGVIIGSALVELIRSADSDTEAVSKVHGFLTEVKTAIQDGSHARARHGKRQG